MNPNKASCLRFLLLGLLVLMILCQSAGLSTALIEFERYREWVEGIGRYAEISVYQLSHAKTGYTPVREILDDSGLYHYEKFDQRWMRELDQMKRMARDESERWVYYSGMAQAVLLDRIDPDWKSRIFEPGIWLDGLLEETVMNTDDVRLFMCLTFAATGSSGYSGPPL